MDLDKARYVLEGVAGYYIDHNSFSPELPQNSSDPNTALPHILFNFWYPPEEQKAEKYFRELQNRFQGDKCPIGAGVFVRPAGDVLAEKDYEYDPEGLEGFFEAAIKTDMPVWINVSGIQWTEVCYKSSPLLRRLETKSENLMWLKDGNQVPTKLQPPADILPGFLRGRFGFDGNGVTYFDYQAPEVQEYHERNLAQMAEVVSDFAGSYPKLFLAITTGNETDGPGQWIIRNRQVRGHEGGEGVVRERLERDVQIYQEAGLSHIYTNQSVADAETRWSPLSTANIEGANIGVTAWGLGNEALYMETAMLAWQKRKTWAVPVMNPRSLDYESCTDELGRAIFWKPDAVGIYNWWPHFWGYGVRGLPLQNAIRSFTR